MGKINEFPCGTETLLQMRRSPLVQRIIRLIEDKVAAHVSGEVPQGDTNPEDFVVDVDDDGTHDPDRQLRDEHVRATLVGKSWAVLSRCSLVQMYDAADFSPERSVNSGDD